MDEHNVCRWFKRHRNLLAEVHWPGKSLTGGSTVVLKQYSARTPLHALRLRFGKKRAVRHWNNAWLLKRHGINTPLPVLLALDLSDPAHQGIMAVETVRTHWRARDILARNHETSAQPESRQTRQLVRCLGRYVREIHDCGIVHRDLSAANILVPEDWNPDSTELKRQFVLLDINRVRKVSPEQMSANLRIQDLERVQVPEHLVEELFNAYAGGSADIAGIQQKFLKYRHGYRRIRDTRNPFIRGLLKIFTYWPRTG